MLNCFNKHRQFSYSYLIIYLFFSFLFFWNRRRYLCICILLQSLASFLINLRQVYFVMQQFGAIALICPWKYCSWHSRMQFPCGNETGWVTIEENWIQVCIEEKSMNFKTGNILRSLAPDNEREIESEREAEREQPSKRSAWQLM